MLGLGVASGGEGQFLSSGENVVELAAAKPA